MTKELTQQEATELIATKVMGWESHKNGKYLRVEKGRYVRKERYNPFDNRRLHRCFEALEKWCPDNSDKSWNIEHVEEVKCVTLYEARKTVMGWDATIHTEHQSLNVAIITALCSAVLGEQVTIKEEV